MAISGYLAGFLVSDPARAVRLGAARRLRRRGTGRVRGVAVHRRRAYLRRGHRGVHLHLHHPHGHREHEGRGRRPWACSACRHRGSPARTGGSSSGSSTALCCSSGFLIHRFDHSRLGPGRLGGVHGQGPGLITRGGQRRSWACLCRRSAARRRRLRRAVRLHLPEPSPRLLHLPPRGHFHDRDLRGRLRHPWGSLVATPILYGVPLLFPPAVAVLAHRDLRCRC